MGLALRARTLVAGEAHGELLVLSEGLSFWGGLDPASGVIIDRQHPQRDARVTGRILLLPAPRGSTAAPGALLECLAAGMGPAAILLLCNDPTPIAAVLVGQMIGLPTIPVALLEDLTDTDSLVNGHFASLMQDWLKIDY
tara:strand:- start:285316 stop:285735 length:420 start_codon:yes stop_codon:yes gene_type:complete